MQGLCDELQHDHYINQGIYTGKINAPGRRNSTRITTMGNQTDLNTGGNSNRQTTPSHHVGPNSSLFVSNNANASSITPTGIVTPGGDQNPGPEPRQDPLQNPNDGNAINSSQNPPQNPNDANANASLTTPTNPVPQGGDQNPGPGPRQDPPQNPNDGDGNANASSETATDAPNLNDDNANASSNTPTNPVPQGGGKNLILQDLSNRLRDVRDNNRTTPLATSTVTSGDDANLLSHLQRRLRNLTISGTDSNTGTQKNNDKKQNSSLGTANINNNLSTTSPNEISLVHADQVFSPPSLSNNYHRRESDSSISSHGSITKQSQIHQSIKPVISCIRDQQERLRQIQKSVVMDNPP